MRYDDAAALKGVSVHVLGSGMNDNIGAKLKRFAEDRRRKGIVYDQGDMMRVGYSSEFFNIADNEGRIG